MFDIIKKVVTFVKIHMKSILIASDLFCVGIAFLFATYLKFDAPYYFPDWFNSNALIVLLVDLVVTAICFFVSKIHNRMWQYFVSRDYAILVIAFMVSKVITVIPFVYIWLDNTRSFFAFIALYSVLFILLLIAVRGLILISYNLWRTKILAAKKSENSKKKRVMIIGAGSAAIRLISELRGVNYVNRYQVVALMDDNKRKHGEYLYGVKVFGGRDKITKVAKELDVDEIYFAVPSATEKSRKEILEICNQTGCVLKTLPKIADMCENENNGIKLRKVDYTDLLGREQIKPDLTKVFDLLKGQTVLVTGGGGSIGGELVRQISASGVAERIIIFDIAENGAYDIQQEIRRHYPRVDLKVLIGSIRDEQRLCEIFEEYRPSIVYHAAAHKHVPLMEDSPEEAVKNNVFGTYNCALCAEKYSAEKFILISTDKAVNPTNVMGATKRMCEMIVQTLEKENKTEFVAVRFGNVLGSNGSVIPLFEKQIAKGGPVTVTHPDIIRYFMTIPEAVELLLMAGNMAKGGEIFVLDMGEPVKIADLARQIIRLKGLIPDRDIEIKYSGLRPGEKLFEELLMAEEGIKQTVHKKIFIGMPINFDHNKFFVQLEELRPYAYSNNSEKIVELIKDIVPTYMKADVYNEMQKKVLARI